MSAARTLTPRDKFIMALEGKQPPGRVPHFELVYFLTMEVFGRVCSSQRVYDQWGQMSARERKLHRDDLADLSIQIAERFEHSAIFFHPPKGWSDEDAMDALEVIRQKTGDKYFLMMHGDSTYSIPNGDSMVEFSAWMMEQPQEVKDKAQKRLEQTLERAQKYRRHGALDGFAMCADYCFNDNPFFSPAMFDDFVLPYLTELCAGYRKLGLYAIKHTDGNIMPILDKLVSARPHALHSLDPQGSVDIAEVKRRVGKQVCLIGNVSCAMLDTGTDEQVIESTRYALQSGMPGGGYIFSTSNCVYTGMNPARYELMLDVWRREGNYPE